VVVDGGIVTSRRPDGLPAFCSALRETFVDGAQAKQGRFTGAQRLVRDPFLGR